jgi:hypothetical protein
LHLHFEQESSLSVGFLPFEIQFQKNKTA